jgi:transposase-like protein
MKADEFHGLLGQASRLSQRQRATLTRLLSEAPAEETVVALLESKDTDQRRCPHCGGEHLHAWGKAHGLRRHRCTDCRRSFNALTGTPLARLRHKERWLTHGEALRDALSVRATAERCGVAVSTAFRWRHRFLRGAKTKQPNRLSGIVEADETFFRRSFKGSRRRNPAGAAPRSTNWCRY